MKIIIAILNIFGLYCVCFTLYLFFIMLLDNISRLPIKSDWGINLYTYSLLYAPVVLLILCVFFLIFKKRTPRATFYFWMYFGSFLLYILSILIYLVKGGQM